MMGTAELDDIDTMMLLDCFDEKPSSLVMEVGSHDESTAAADLHDQLIALGFTIFIIPDRGNMFRASREQVLGKGDCLNLVCLKGHGL